MALHINLYNELQKQAQARRRDPVKLAILSGVLLVALFVFYYGYRRSVVGGLDVKVSGLKDEWAQLQPQQTNAKAREAELLGQQKANQALVARVQSRFYWAPFLERFGLAVPGNVQITSLVGDSPAPGKPTVTVLLSGIAAGQQPRSVAEQFRITLQQKLSKDYGGLEAMFDANSLEDGAATVDLNGQSLSTATFRIRLQFKAEPPAAAQTPTPSPTPRARKK